MLRIKALITGGLSVLLMFVIFIGGLSLFSEKAGIMNEGLFKNLAIIFAAVSIMIASVIAARMGDGKGWLYGMIMGVFWLIITAVIALVVNQGFFSTGFGFYAIIFILCGCLGGMLGVGKRRKIKY